MKKQLRTSFFLIYFFFLLTTVYAQHTIEGIVKDSEQKDVLPGVTVQVKNTPRGTITDFEGRFVLKANKGQTLVFSYVGYKTAEIKVGDSQYVEILLSEDVALIDEVLVVGYGVQTKASSVGSIVTTKGDELLQTGGVSDVSQALQGMMAGVTAISTSAKPGDEAATLLIRGKGTWQDATPLVLVDGIERDFNDIDINEIESLSVLKDASATAVYGVKGANGVILITTKRGDNQKAQIKFSANFGFKTPTAKLEWADYLTSMKMYNEAMHNDKNWSNMIPQSTITAWENAYATGNYGPYNDYFPEVNWWDETVKDFGIQQQYNINMTGGSDRMKYFMSLGYTDDGDVYKTYKQENFDPSFSFQRYNWRYNMDFDVSKTTRMKMNIAGKMSFRNQPVYQALEDGDSYFFSPYLTTPTNSFPIRYSDGEWGDDFGGRANIVANMLTGGQVRRKTFQGFYDFIIEQKLDVLLKGLSAKGTVSYTSNSDTQMNIIDNGMYGSATNTTNGPKQEIRYYRTYDYSSPIHNPDGSVSYPLSGNIRFPNDEATPNLPVTVGYDMFRRYYRKLYYEFALNYSEKQGDHDYSALVLFLRRNNISTNSRKDTNMEFASYEEDWVGRVTYSYKSRYLAEVNASYTGSERFAKGKRFGFFPSFSIGWRISEEPWLNPWKNTWSNLKIRYSYGKVGNDKGAPRFNYMQIYTSSGEVQFGKVQTVKFSPIYIEGSLADPNATWETTVKQNIGVEIGLANKFNMIVDLYDERRTGILMEPESPAYLGVALPALNIGITKNHGIDFEAAWNEKLSSRFRYYLKLNVSSSENRVVFKDDPEALDEYLKASGKPIGVATKYLAVGNYTSVDDVFNGPQTNLKGDVQSTIVPGDLFYVDYNGDGVINSEDVVPVSQTDIPLTTFGLTLGGQYCNFGFNILFYAAPNLYRESISSLLWDFPSGNIKAQSNTLDRWTPADIGANGPIRPAVHLDNTHNAVGSTFSYTDHAYVRLKTMEVNYSIPRRLISRFYLSDCLVYVNGNNLFTFTNADSRRDPETSSGNVYPIVQRYNIGLRLTF